jgi:hypothetical protein
MAEQDYGRLTRAKSRSVFGIVSTTRASLWAGKDHLLQIDNTGFSEAYKRFYFRDIQALVLCKTDTWLYRAVAYAAVASLCGLIAIIGGGPVASWFFGGMAGLFALLIAVDLMAGPTCKAYLRTAVQTEALAPLNRLRRAQKVFGILRPLITSAQEELATRRAAPESQELASPAATAGMSGPGPKRAGEVSSPPTERQL